MAPKLEFVQDWLQLAQTDMESARHLLTRKPPLLAPACFHAQQVVEKALKAILVLNDQRPPHTHTLADLFGLCERWLPEIADHELQCAWLTPFAVDARYPQRPPSVTLDLAEQGVKAAEETLNYVLSNCPPEARPTI